MAEETTPLGQDVSRFADIVNDRLGDWFAEVGRVMIMLGTATRFLWKGLRSFGLVVEQMHRMAQRNPEFLGFAHFGPDYRVAETLRNAEARIWDWVRIVEGMTNLDDKAATEELRRWSRAHYLDLGFAEEDIVKYEAKTFWPMQVAGIRRWLATRQT